MLHLCDKVRYEPSRARSGTAQGTGGGVTNRAGTMQL